MPNNRRLQDASLNSTIALPTAASSSVYSTPIELSPDANGDNAIQADYSLSAPALNATELPNGTTVTYQIQTSATEGFGSPVNGQIVGTQTGASSAGAAAAEWIFRLPTTAGDYVRIAATTSSGTGSCAASSFTLGPSF